VFGTPAASDQLVVIGGGEGKRLVQVDVRLLRQHVACVTCLCRDKCGMCDLVAAFVTGMSNLERPCDTGGAWFETCRLQVVMQVMHTLEMVDFYLVEGEVERVFLAFKEGLPLEARHTQQCVCCAVAALRSVACDSCHESWLQGPVHVA
jgi:hypothetical protein